MTSITEISTAFFQVIAVLQTRTDYYPDVDGIFLHVPLCLEVSPKRDAATTMHHGGGGDLNVYSCVIRPNNHFPIYLGIPRVTLGEILGYVNLTL